MKRLFMMFVLLSVIVVSGCGGNGGDSGSTGPFRGGIVPVRITLEGARDRDGIFAYAGGDGVTGGWVETTQGTRISDPFRMNYSLMRYETTLIGNTVSSFANNYILKYIQNGETLSLTVENIPWTLMSNFSGTPWLVYDGKQSVDIHFEPLPGADVKYFMRLLDSSTNTIVKESLANPYSGSIIESITPQTGRWEIHLIADTYENDVLKRRNIHIFPDVFN